MYDFLIKRSFWNYMDSMLSAVLVNLVFFAFTIGSGFAYAYTPDLPIIKYGIIIFYIFFLSHYLLITALYSHTASGKKSFGVREALTFLRRNWLKSLQLFLFIVFLVSIGFLSLPFYILLGGIPGAVGAAIISWILVLSILTIMLLCPLLVRAQMGFVRSVKTAFLMVIGNPLPLLFFTLMTFIMLFFSILFLFIIPGLTAVMLFSETLVSLFEKKQEWLVQENGQSRKNVPWKELLENESKDLNRSLLDFMFPFKRK